ncbi:c-type cytochrome domain-containing protein [Fodinibius sp.]|uniref:c-type cytochrome domain-containing protein n=1 Tax=Fodinibius sp. TaxID=1872440 RepID=UPI003564ECA7
MQPDLDTDSSSDFVLFIGRFHPLIVHLPIGLLLFAFFLECLALFERFKKLRHAVPLALLAGGISAVFSVLTGYLLSSGGGYGEDLLSVHQWLGITVVVLSFLAFILRTTFYDYPVVKKMYGPVLVLMVGTLMATGHQGGNLTHGTGYLTRYMPEPLRTMIGSPPLEVKEIKKIENIDSAMVYEDIIYPILDTRCVSCHNPDKKKGELMMTTFEHLMEGGESGPVLEARNAEGSDLYRRLLLPESDDDHMPPEGKLQLTPDQIELIGWWIDQGAPQGSVVSELEVTDDISGALFKLTDEGKSFFEKTEVPKADDVLVEELRGQGLKVLPVANGSNFLQVQFTKPPDSIGGQDMELLLPLSEQITWIDLGQIPVTDADLTVLPEFKNLTRLHLEQTNVTDSLLVNVSGLENLEYLNLYATDITDEGLEYLENSKNLRSLYVWQTQVSEEKVLELKEKLPELYIDTGWKKSPGENDGNAPED